MRHATLTNINQSLAERRRRVAVSRPLLLAVVASVAWALIVFAKADPTYGPGALVSSVLLFVATAAFIVWPAPPARMHIRVIGIAVTVQTFMGTGLSVINEVSFESVRSRPTTEGYDFAVVGGIVFAICFLVGVWLAGPTSNHRSDLPLESSGPTSTMAWVLAATATATTLLVGLGWGRSLGILPLIILNPSLIVPLLMARNLSRPRVSRVPLLVLVGAHVLLTLQTSMLGVTAGAVRDVALTLIALGRRIPVGAFAVAIVAFLVFNPAKAVFRQHVVQHGPVTFEQSIAVWEDAFEQTWSTQTVERTEAREAALKTTTSRLDQNSAVAHVYTVVPDRMPHKLGRTYEDIPLLLVPRILYPDKPTSQGHTRSRWLVELGLQDPRSIDTVAISLPAAAEAYWNFGWLGVFVVPLSFGLAVGLILRVRVSDPIARTAWLVLVATSCTAFGDMLVWVVPQVVIALMSVALVSFYCKVGRTRRAARARSPNGDVARLGNAAAGAHQ